MKFPEQYRWLDAGHGYESNPGDPFGVFAVPAMDAKGRRLNIIASSAYKEYEWDHVSVTIHESSATPTWEEMCLVKDLFWDDNEAVVQFHPPKSAYKNLHQGCLHMWRPLRGFDMPPIECV